MDCDRGSFCRGADPRQDEIGSHAATERAAEKIREAGGNLKSSGYKRNGGTGRQPGDRGNRYARAHRYDGADGPAERDVWFHCYSQSAAISSHNAESNSAANGISFAGFDRGANRRAGDTCCLGLPARVYLSPSETAPFSIRGLNSAAFDHTNGGASGGR